MRLWKNKGQFEYLLQISQEDIKLEKWTSAKERDDLLSFTLAFKALM